MNAEAESLIEVRKSLKEANSYDPTLSEHEMLELYQALKDSQKTATEEDEQRRIFEQTETNCSIVDELRTNSHEYVPKDPLQSMDNEIIQKNEDMVCSSSEEDMLTKLKEKPFLPKKWSQQKKQSKPLPDFENKVSSTSTPVENFEQKHTEEKEDLDIVDFVDAFDSVPTLHKPLKLISPNPKYSPPFYCNPKITKIDYKERARMIANYHLELFEKYSKYQRQSTFPAPWGKPIQTSLRFNGSLMKSNEKLEENSESLQENIAVDNLETVKEDKSSDEDFEIYVSKSGRQTKRKLYSENVDSNGNEWKRKSKPSPIVEEDMKKVHPKKRRISLVSKEETMKRSKLFADNVNSSRAEKMFEKLVEEGHKKKETEKMMEKFNETLESLSGEEDVEDFNNVAELVHSEEPFIRRRVVPVTHSKKAANAGRNKTTGRFKGRNKISSESSSQETGSQKYDPLNIEISTDGSNSKQKAACPVCFEEFFQSELMEHTPICLDTNNQNSTKPVDFCQTRITCETCDKVFALDLQYEDHVKKCLAKQL